MNLKKILFVFLLVLTVIPIQAYAAVNKNLPPQDLKILKDKLSKSFVGIECNNKIGIGFTGNYNITQENKNNGINSLIVTNKDLIWKCVSSFTRQVSVKYQNSNFNSNVWGWSALNSEDYATVASSLNLDKIDLYGTEFPEVGWWVMIASYLPQFGITWTESKIVGVNKDDYTLLLDSSPMTLGTGGPVFDNSGTFLGIVTFVQNQNTNLAKVSGAPNICNTKGSLSGTGIADCWAGSKDKIWKQTSTSSTQISPELNSSQEAVDALKTLEDAYSAYQESISQCKETYNSATVTATKYLKVLKLDSICSFEELQAKNILSKARAIGNLKQFGNNEIDQLNSYTDSMNSFVEGADSANAKIQDTITYINYALDSQAEVKLVKLFASSKWSQINSRIAKLSKAMKSKIVNTPEYIEITESLTQWSEFSNLVNIFLNSISPTSNLGYLENSNSELKTMEPQVTSSSLEYDAAAISGLLPKYVCTKGKDVVAIVGEKCKTGYKKITV